MPNANDTKTYNLDAVNPVAGKVTVKGRTYVVRPVDGFGYEIVANMGTGQDAIANLYRVAQRCVPDMPEDVLKSLTIQQVQLVGEIASGTAKAVERSAATNPPKAGAKRKRAAPSPA